MIKVRFIFFIFAFVFFTSLKFQNVFTEERSQIENLKVYVHGLVCDFCARSLEKLFNKNDSVNNVEINLDEMLVTIQLKENKNLNDDTIKKLVEDSGYNVVLINRVKKYK